MQQRCRCARPTTLSGQLVALGRKPNGGLFVVPSITTNQHQVLIAQLAIHYHLPSMCSDLPRRLRPMSIAFSGEKPRDLPVQLPVRFLFIVSLKTAKAIGTRHSGKCACARR